jgi:aminoglycoside 3-N-acetyltransferase
LVVLKKIFSSFPFAEVSVRRLYYFLTRNNLISSKVIVPNVYDGKTSDFECVKEHIMSLGIQKGDILIVHSSYVELKKLNVNPLSIISFLRDIVGDDGTLVFPSFYKKNENNNINMNSKICTTGLLPAMFLRIKGVLRSEFPENSLAAQGPKAKAMFSGDLSSDLAHGKGSAWHYCAENNAKILLLGVQASKSLTMVHVAEDVLDERWPIKNWYENETFYLDYNSKIVERTVRVRRQFWSRFMTLEYRTKWLKSNDLLNEKTIEGVNIAYVHDSKLLVDTLVTNMIQRKVSFFRPPSKYWKNNCD